MTRFAVALAAVSILFGSLTSLAEEPAPKFEVFGGYSFVHTNNGQVDGPALDSLFVQTPGTFSLKNNYSGWNATAQYNANRWLGLAADFGGHYGAPVTAAADSGITGFPNARSHSFLFGPVLTYRTSKLSPFVHALFGVDHFSTDTTDLGGFAVAPVNLSSSAFAMALGGGADYNVNKRFAIRLGQLDYLYTRHDVNSIINAALGPDTVSGVADHQNNVRFSTGIVVRF